jgi:hypothetical protein
MVKFISSIHAPFSAADKDGAYAIRFANGTVFAGCHHASCGGGKQRWNELRERYETPEERQEQRINAGKKERAKAKTAAESVLPAPESGAAQPLSVCPDRCGKCRAVHCDGRWRCLLLCDFQCMISL